MKHQVVTALVKQAYQTHEALFDQCEAKSQDFAETINLIEHAKGEINDAQLATRMQSWIKDQAA